VGQVVADEAGVAAERQKQGKFLVAPMNWSPNGFRRRRWGAYQEQGSTVERVFYKMP
jgi:hypothetical protein